MASDITLATFKTIFPEFNALGDTVISAHLEWARSMCNETTWGDLRDQGIALKAADSLALSPGAQQMRLASKQGKSIYQDRYDKLVKIVGGGFYVVEDTAIINAI